jgi:hypothetical protein
MVGGAFEAHDLADHEVLRGHHVLALASGVDVVQPVGLGPELVRVALAFEPGQGLLHRLERHRSISIHVALLATLLCDPRVAPASSAPWDPPFGRARPLRRTP